MKRTLEAIFRYPLQLLVLIILLPVVGVAIPYFMVPRTYQATALVWALQRYYVIGATGTESDQYTPPAETQTTVLTELLQTSSFAMAVAQGIDLEPSLGLSHAAMNDPQQLQAALQGNISKYVIATPLAYNLYSISYSSHDPKIAQEVVKSVIANFSVQSLRLSAAEGQNFLAIYQTQLANAQKTLNDAVTTETQYVRAHPGVSPTDPQFELLDGQRIQAQSTVQSIQNVINQIQRSIGAQSSDANTLFRVIDEPQVPNQPLSRTRDYMVGGGLGLTVALLTYIIFLVIVVRRNRGVYSAHDLQDLVAFPVVMQLPSLTSAAVSQLTMRTMHGQASLTDGKSSSNDHKTRS